jgi:hypothetical protein
LPQLLGDVMSTSQPSSGVALQCAKPALHAAAGITHLLATH